MTTATAPPALDRLADAYWEAFLRRHPTFATAIGDRRFDDRLEDESPAARDAWRSTLDGFERELDAIGDGGDPTTRAALADALGVDRAVLDADVAAYTVDPMNGPQVVFKPIGVVRSPYTESSQIPKGAGAKHDAEGVLELDPELELGLTDIEGFSHLFVLWVFDRSTDFDLMAHPPIDEKRPHGVFATRSPRRPNPIGLTVVRLVRREGHRLHVVLEGVGTELGTVEPCQDGQGSDQGPRGRAA